MLDNHGFDIWADGYDEDVHTADSNNRYPFAGYKMIMGTIFEMIMKKSPVKILDIGIGTGTLSSQLYARGNDITGVDFSQKMLRLAREKMPNAILIPFDIGKGLPPEIVEQKFDFIISTYALHHLTDNEKVGIIRSLLGHINDAGSIVIGDVSFLSREDLENCKITCGEDDWDDDEYYFVYSELKEALGGDCKTKYHQISHCSGILEITP